MTESAVMTARAALLKTTRQFDDALKGLGLPKNRKPQQQRSKLVPENMRIVSADNHWSPSQDIFYERLPGRLKDKAPRIVVDEEGTPRWKINGKDIFPPSIQPIASSFEVIPGSSHIPARLRDLDAEGIDEEIVFGNSVGALYTFPDLDLRERAFRIYNEHLAEQAALSKGRFHGVGLINYWEPGAARSSIDELQALGLKTFLIPITPKGANGQPLNYALPEMDPLWAAIEEAGLPVCFHIGEFVREGPGAMATTIMENTAPFRPVLGQLIFGGIFDRHPGLQVAFVEAEINWVPGALQTASMLSETFAALIDPKIKRHPREYWAKNCSVSMTQDPAGMSMLDVIGTDRVMWSADYPHIESSYGVGWHSLEAVVGGTTPAEAAAILGGNAIKLFKL